MKKFKQLFDESSSPAQDYKQKKDDEKEVKDIKPRSKGEEDFVAQHKVNKKVHPVAPETQHTGGTKSGDKGNVGKGETVLKTYNQFAKMGGYGGDSYKGAGNSAGEKATVMQGSSKIKEEVDLDEALKVGSLKLKSGETVKLDDSNAKALNSAMERLSGKNQLAMKAEVLKDKKSFEAMIKFAKSVT